MQTRNRLEQLFSDYNTTKSRHQDESGLKRLDLSLGEKHYCIKFKIASLQKKLISNLKKRKNI